MACPVLLSCVLILSCLYCFMLSWGRRGGSLKFVSCLIFTLLSFLVIDCLVVFSCSVILYKSCLVLSSLLLSCLGIYCFVFSCICIVLLWPFFLPTPVSLCVFLIVELHVTSCLLFSLFSSLLFSCRLCLSLVFVSCLFVLGLGIGLAPPLPLSQKAEG